MRNGGASVIHASMQLPCGLHQRYLPIAEAERLRERGECRKVRLPSKKIVGRARPVYRLIEQARPSTSQESTCAITSSDMLKNLGLVGSKDQIREARTKIREYRKVQQHDPQYAG